MYVSFKMLALPEPRRRVIICGDGRYVINIIVNKGFRARQLEETVVPRTAESTGCV